MAERIPQAATGTLRVPLKCYLASDHVTPAGTVTVAVLISKNGGAFGNPNAGATNATEFGGAGNGHGWYYVDLDATDRGTLGPLVVRGTSATIDDAEVAYDVVPAHNAGFDALPDAAAEAAGGLYTRGTGAGQINQPANGQIDANAVKVGGTSQTGRDLGASVLLSPGTGAGQVDLTSGVVKANLAQILGTALTETAGQLAAAFKQFFNIATPAATMDHLVLVDTATNLTNAPTAGDLTATMKASVTTAATAATPTAAAVTGAVGSVTADVGITQAGADKVWASASRTLTAFSTALALSVWDVLAAAVATASSIGLQIKTNLDAAVSTRSTYAGGDTAGTTTLLTRVPSALTITGGKVDVNDKTGFSLSAAGVQAVWDALTTALTTVGSIGKWFVDKLDVVVSTRLASSAYTAPPTVGQIADQVWDEALADHLGAGSTGAGLNAAGSAGDPWNTALPGAYGVGTAGKIVGTNLDAAMSSRLATSGYTAPDNAGITAIKAKTDLIPAGGPPAASDYTGARAAKLDDLDAAISTRLASTGYTAPDNAGIAAVKAKTDNLPGDPADESLIVAATDAIMTRLGAPAGASTAADIAAVKGDTAAVKSKTDQLAFTVANRVDATADKAGYKLAADGLDSVAAPADLANDAAGRASFVGMVRALFNRFYNKATQTATQQKIHSDAGAVVSTMAVSDDGVTQDKAKSA